MVMTQARPESSGAVRPTLVDGDIHTTFASAALLVLSGALVARQQRFHGSQRANSASHSSSDRSISS